QASSCPTSHSSLRPRHTRAFASVTRTCMLGLCVWGSAHHRDLPPFPTRRSSDLSAGASAVASPRFAGRSSARRESSGGSAKSSRSEEHTSELQSRENLVCRLLLEKKKSRCAAIRLAEGDNSAFPGKKHQRAAE